MKKLLFLIFAAVLTFYILLKDKSYEKNTIYIGSSLPKTGTMKEYGKAVQDGTNAYFSYVNQNNILKDKKIQLIAYDDKYEPKITLKNTTKLLENKDIFALYGLVGTPTVKNTLPLIEKENIPLVGTFSGASCLRSTHNKYIINIRNSYHNEIKEHIKYLYHVKGFTKIAVFYQNDAYGEDGYVSVVKILKSYGLSPVAEGSYKRNTLSIRHAFYSIQDANPEAIIMIGANKANTLFIKKAKMYRNFDDTLFCNISFGDASQMIKNLDGNTKNIIFSQIVPNYQDKSIGIIKEYHQALKAYDENIQPSFISLEAFINAKILVKALQNVKGTLTRKNFIQQIRKLPKDTINGLLIYPSRQNFLDQIYLFKYENNKFKEILNKKEPDL